MVTGIDLWNCYPRAAILIVPMENRTDATARIPSLLNSPVFCFFGGRRAVGAG